MKRIILFDGECNFCNSSVNFIIKNDTKNYYKFMSLQNSKAMQLVDAKINFNTLYLLEEKKVYSRSTAALKIASKLRFPFNLLSVFLIIPPFARNWVYDIIAKNRYNILGKSEKCMVPSHTFNDKFIL